MQIKQIFKRVQGRQTGGGVGWGGLNPLNFGWGVEHLSTPPDLRKIVLGAPLQKRGLLFLTKRLPRKRNQNWRTFDYFQKVIVCESQ